MPRILIIESDDEFSGAIQQRLTEGGNEVEVVTDGSLGLKAAEARTPQLILLCAELPKMNGFSVCNRLRRSASLASTPIVLMSAQASAATFEQHARMPKKKASAYLHKPIGVDELMLGIREWLPAASTMTEPQERASLSPTPAQIEVRARSSSSSSLGVAVASPPAAEPARAPMKTDLGLGEHEDPLSELGAGGVESLPPVAPSEPAARSMRPELESIEAILEPPISELELPVPSPARLEGPASDRLPAVLTEPPPAWSADSSEQLPAGVDGETHELVESVLTEHPLPPSAPQAEASPASTVEASRRDELLQLHKQLKDARDGLTVAEGQVSELQERLELTEEQLSQSQEKLVEALEKLETAGSRKTVGEAVLLERLKETERELRGAENELDQSQARLAGLLDRREAQDKVLNATRTSLRTALQQLEALDSRG